MSKISSVIVQLGGQPGSGKSTIAPHMAEIATAFNQKATVIIDKDAVQPFRDNMVHGLNAMISLCDELTPNAELIARMHEKKRELTWHDREMMPFLMLLQGLTASQNGLNAVIVFPSQLENEKWRPLADRFISEAAIVPIIYSFIWLSCASEIRMSRLKQRASKDPSSSNEIPSPQDNIIDKTGPGGQDMIINSSAIINDPSWQSQLDDFAEHLQTRPEIIPAQSRDLEFITQCVSSKAIRAMPWL